MAGTYGVDHTYKLNGASANTALPAVGGLPAETLTYAYDANGFAQTLTGTWTGGSQSYIADTEYTYDGLIAKQWLGNPGKQVRQSMVLDASSRRISAAHTDLETSPGTFTSKYIYDYTYDNAGNILSAGTLTDNVRDQVECFRYDHLRRLTEAWTQAAGGSGCITPQRAGVDPYWRQWTFDAIGNRLTQTDLVPNGANTTWTYTVGSEGGVKPHQLQQVTATGPLGGPTRSYTYDNAGNTVAATTPTGTAQALTWDKENHLATITEAGTTTAEYVYDAGGRRLISRTPTKTTLYLPDGTELELASGAGSPLGTRYYAGIAVRHPAGLKWTISNHQGTAVVQIDASALNATRRRMLPYGEDRGSQPTSWMGTKHFVGGTKDSSGYTHLGAREYDPSIGRFVSTDQIIDPNNPQQWHPYSYGNNSPITFNDPDGRFPRPEERCRCGGAAFGGRGPNPGFSRLDGASGRVSAVASRLNAKTVSARLSRVEKQLERLTEGKVQTRKGNPAIDIILSVGIALGLKSALEEITGPEEAPTRTSVGLGDGQWLFSDGSVRNLTGSIIYRPPGHFQLSDNKMKGLEEELARADKLGVKAVSPGSNEFDAIVNNGTVKWAVLQDGTLVVIPKFVSGIEIPHSVLSRGAPVWAAGEAEIVGSSAGGYFGLSINHHSGHFRPAEATLEIGKAAFAAKRIVF